MAMTVKRMAKLKSPGRYRDPDSRGLYLQVGRAGGRSWLLRYEIDGRERFMGLGSLADFTLKEARERARTARQKLADGVDPIEQRLAEQEARRAEEAANTTFKQAAEQYLALYGDGWRNAKHRQQWANTLATYVYPTLGMRPVRVIDAALINATLAPIWATIPETASRVKQRVERVIQWVKDGKPLPRPSAGRRVKHHKALPWQELPAFMAALRQRDGTSPRALEFLILTAARTGEVLGATWDEIDMKEKTWAVGAERMKAGKPHRVPLSDRALEILKSLPREKGNPYVFIGGAKGKPLSNMALLQLMRGMGSEYVTHGFRSTFKDWASEATSHPNAVSEQALAHTIGNAVERAYRRGDLFAKRVRLMRDWAAYCTRPAGDGKVVPIRAAR
jgi:integrase